VTARRAARTASAESPFAKPKAKDFTQASRRVFNKTRNPADLIPIDEGVGINDITPANYTGASLDKFKKSRNFKDLVPVPDSGDIFGDVDPSKFTPASLANFAKSNNFADLVPVDTPQPVGVHTLPDGSRITNSQLLSQYKQDNDILDDIDIQILAVRNPELAAKERARAANAIPFDEWAQSKFGIDIRGGFQPPEGPRETDTSPVAIPAKKEQLIVGQRYNTSRGLAVWNGTMFESLDGGR